MSKRLRLSAIAVPLFAIAPFPSLAQEDGTAPASQPDTRLEEVVVTGDSEQPNERLSLDSANTTGSRLNLTPRETPASVTIVDRATIEQRGATNTQEILGSVPGLTAASPPGSAGSVWYRGFSTTSITQLFNGITVQYDAIAARPVDSWIYDRVEVVGGPSTFLFGAGAVGGSINYITKLANRDGDAGQARVSYGSYDTSELAVGINRRLGSDEGVRNYVRADMSRTHTNGYVDGNAREAWTGAVSLLTDISPQLSHTLALEYQNEMVDRPYWGTPVLNPIGEARIDPEARFKNYNSSDGIYEQTVMWARSIIDYRVSDATSVRNTLYHYDALRDYRNVERYTYTADNSAVVRAAAYLQRHDQGLTGERVEVLHKSTLAGRPSDWSAGADFSINRQTRFPLSLGSTVISTVDPINFTTESFFDIPGMVPGFNPDRTNDVTTLAMFLENRTRLLDTLSLVTGLRHDKIDLEVTNHRTVTATDPAYFKNTYRPTTGRIGLVYDLSPASNVYVQYSTAADPPAGILTTASFSQVRDFDLTTGEQWEIGSKTDFLQGRGTATLAAYTITRKNLAMTDPDNPGTTIPVGQQSSRGIELAASLRVSRPWLVQGNAAYVDAQYDDFTESVSGVAVSRAGNIPTGIPSSVANLWLIYTINPDWQAGLDARYVASRYRNTANTLEVPAYTLYGAFTSYRIWEDTTLTARVRNLTDEIYAQSTGTTQLFLGAPRTFELALQTSF